MRVACLTPLPPAKSGIANYSAMLLPALGSWAEVTAVTGQAEVTFDSTPVMTIAEYERRRSEFEVVIYQLGNNLHHELVLREALQHPGIAVLHEFVLHHLIVEMTLARGDKQGYIRAMAASHGEMGRAWAMGRAEGFELELANFLFPASIEVAQRSRRVIVHNAYSRQRLESMGVTTPIDVVAHPFSPPTLSPAGRELIRRRHGFDSREPVVAMIGFVTAAKRPEVVFEAFARARERDASVRLLLVGEAAPNVPLEELAAAHGLPRGSWTITGYVDEAELDGYIAAADRVINLRYPTAGETSGTLIRVLGVGRPVAVNDFAQFAEIPGELVTRVPLGDGETERLAEFMLSHDNGKKLAAAQRKWLEEHASLSSVSEGYRRAAEAAGVGPPARQQASRLRSMSGIPLFPQLHAEIGVTGGEAGRWRVEVTLRNEGADRISARSYGEPAYRFRIRASDGASVVYDEPFSLEGDLGEGSSGTIGTTVVWPEIDRVELFGFLEGFPALRTAPLAAWERSR